MKKKEKTKRTENTHQLEESKTLANRRRLAKARTSGITLIALVVTIVVLLILAGLTINMVFSENGIFSTATDSKTKSKLAEIEDSATVIYSSLVAQKYVTGSNAPITTADVIAELSKQAEQGGYTIEPIALSENAVTGIEVEEKNIILALGEEKEIIVKFGGAEGGYAYYVVLEGSYYAIELKNGKVNVSKKAEETKPGAGEASGELSATIAPKEESATTKITATVENPKGNVVKVKAGDTVDNATVTIKYGEYEETCNITVAAKPSTGSEADATVSFSTNYGTIDVIWLSGTSNTVASEPNSPVGSLTSGGNSMTPVVFQAGTTPTWNPVSLDSISADSKNWYEYKAGSSTRNADGKMVDNNSSHWANARTANNSYFVWIPRYAYRITYYDSETSTTPTGYYDGYGMWKAEDGKVKYKLESEIQTETVEYNGNLYIVHPAFTDRVNMGGWSTPTQGFWFAKFEMGEENNVLNSIYGQPSLVRQTIGQLYTKGLTATYGYTVTANSDGNTSFMYSHMSKNSEWGAVAYLTHSQYGRNGNEITINNQGSVSYRGGGIGNAYANADNQKQSTTGNVYGVYDMSGNAYEYTASWDTLAADPNNRMPNGSSFARKGGPSTKYATAYENGTDTDYGATGTKNVYNVSKTGDGIKEVCKPSMNNNTGWFGDYSYFVYTSSPFFIRGGASDNGDNAGVFSSVRGNGGAYSAYSFHAVLCP